MRFQGLLDSYRQLNRLGRPAFLQEMFFVSTARECHNLHPNSQIGWPTRYWLG